MAAGAGQAAAINAALPIAQQDAAQNLQNAQFNAGAQNTSNLNAANAANTSAAQNMATQNPASGQASAVPSIITVEVLGYGGPGGGSGTEGEDGEQRDGDRRSAAL